MLWRSFLDAYRARMALGPDTELRFLPGIGPARAAQLALAGLRTVADVLCRVPRLVGPPPPLHAGGPLPRGVHLRVRVQLLRTRPLFGRGRGRGLGAEAACTQSDGTPLRARFFNAGWLRRHLLPNEWYLLEGRTDDASANLLLHPAFVHLPGGSAQELPEEPTLRVAYRIPDGFAEKGFLTLVQHCLSEGLAAMEDPAGLLSAADWQAALLALHRPETVAQHERSRRLLAEREVLALAWRLHDRRQAMVAVPGQAWTWSDAIHERALARLPFALTPGQQAALADIRRDLQAPTPMYRLLQGDVGSGKTAIALMAALAVIADGGQVLFLAPTAVLARQHGQFVERCLTGSRVRWGVLTSGSAPDEKRRLVADLAAHRLDLLVGTHALLEESVSAARLGLAIIDEQHKFGVAQRAALLDRRHGTASPQPDLLLMTATPIPRTLALTAFGDLAVSRIDGRPPGRAPVTTDVRQGDERLVEQAVAECLASGGQAFVICPLRTGSEHSDASDATSMHQRLAKRFDAARIALLHGALGEEEKLSALARFASGDACVLVATTVVEVGIDVPAATLLVVLDAERFGLAQLHQLRGRLGRGSRAGRCLLLHRTPEAGDRLAVLAASDDGLAIAEADLTARGPGALLGTDQHGAMQLAIAELPRDLDLLQAAHAQVRASSGVMPAGLRRFTGWWDATTALAGG